MGIYGLPRGHNKYHGYTVRGIYTELSLEHREDVNSSALHRSKQRKHGRQKVDGGVAFACLTTLPQNIHMPCETGNAFSETSASDQANRCTVPCTSFFGNVRNIQVKISSVYVFSF